MMKSFKKIFGIILNVFCVVAIVFSLFVTFSPFKTIVFKQVVTGSMKPKVPVGSIVLVSRIPADSIHLNDIINFSLPANAEMNVTHRVVDIDQRVGEILFRTKGDANQSIDIDPVKASQVNGKVIFTIPLLGYLYQLVKQPFGLLFFIVIPALYIIISESLRIKRFIETEAIRKHEHAKANQEPIGSTSLFSVIFILGLVLFATRIPSTRSYFSTGQVLASSFSTGHWSISDDEEDHDEHDNRDHEDDNNNDENHDNHEDEDEHHEDNNHDEDKNDHEERKEEKDDHRDDRPIIDIATDPDKHHCSFVVRNINGFSELDYEVTYDTDKALRGFSGKANFGSQGEYRRDYVPLGSRSAEGGSVFDEGVRNLRIKVLLTHPDGTTETFERSTE